MKDVSLFQILVETATSDQGLDVTIDGGRAAFNIRKNFLIELLKNGGSKFFTPERIELEIEKNHVKVFQNLKGLFRLG